MSKVSAILIRVLLAIAVCSVMLSCAAPSPKELKPIIVKPSMVYPIFLGKESVTLVTALEVSNPNDFEIRLDSFDYLLYANGTKLAGQQYTDDVFIPAGTKIIVTGTSPVAFGSLVGDRSVSGGLSGGQATVEALPDWKAIGGILPAAALQANWDKAPSAVTFEIQGTAYVATDGSTLRVPFAGQYKK